MGVAGCIGNVLQKCSAGGGGAPVLGRKIADMLYGITSATWTVDSAKPGPHAAGDWAPVDVQVGVPPDGSYVRGSGALKFPDPPLTQIEDAIIASRQASSYGNIGLWAIYKGTGALDDPASWTYLPQLAGQTQPPAP